MRARPLKLVPQKGARMFRSLSLRLAPAAVAARDHAAVTGRLSTLK
jgi:hypothetical protein